MKRLLELAVLSVLATSTALALTNNCPTTSTSVSGTFNPNPAGLGATTWARASTGVGALTALNAFTTDDSSITTGCSTVDMIFSSFVITQSGMESPLGGGTTSGLDGTYAFFGSLGPSTTVTFSDVRGSATNGSDQNADDGRRNFYDATAGAGSFTIAYVVSAGTGLGNRLLDLNFFVNGVTLGQSTGSASVATTVCSGFTGTSVTLPFTTCSSGSTLSSSNSLSAGTNNFSFSLGESTTRVAVFQTFTLNAGSGGTAAQNLTSFQTFGLTVVETPEPGTLGMLGAGLLGLGLLARRKR